MNHFIGRDFNFFNMLCFLFFLPICLNLIVVMIGNVLGCYYIVSPNVVRSDTKLKDNKSPIATVQNKPKSTKQQLPKVKTKKKKSKKDEKHKTMMQEASNALNTLGIKKSKANSILKDLCKEKTYNSSEDLLKDAIVYIG